MFRHSIYDNFPQARLFRTLSSFAPPVVAWQAACRGGALRWKGRQKFCMNEAACMHAHSASRGNSTDGIAARAASLHPAWLPQVEAAVGSIKQKFTGRRHIDFTGGGGALWPSARLAVGAWVGSKPVWHARFFAETPRMHAMRWAAASQAQPGKCAGPSWLLPSGCCVTDTPGCLCFLHNCPCS